MQKKLKHSAVFPGPYLWNSENSIEGATPSAINPAPDKTCWSTVKIVSVKNRVGNSISWWDIDNANDPVFIEAQIVFHVNWIMIITLWECTMLFALDSCYLLFIGVRAVILLMNASTCMAMFR